MAKKKPKKKQLYCYTVEMEPEQVKELKKALTKKKFSFKKVPHAHFGAKHEKVSVTMYRSGKLVIQGKDTTDFVQFFLEPEILKEVRLGYEDILDGYQGDRIGVDESGKGDFFGPLVIAGVYVTVESEKKLKEANVRDSKRISPNQILELRKLIRKECRYSVVAIGPERYNQLYSSMENMNRILAWGHARVIENILSRVNCQKAVLDKFAGKDLVLNALMKKGRSIEVEQKVRGESDLAVAAASVLARGEFVLRHKKLCEEFDVDFPLGNNKKAVIEAGRAAIEKHGLDSLVQVAKVHFKTSRDILGIDMD